jgi:hypothetical protein
VKWFLATHNARIGEERKGKERKGEERTKYDRD